MGNFDPKITHSITPFEIFHLLYYASRTSDFSQKNLDVTQMSRRILQRKYKMKDTAEGYLAINGNGTGNASKYWGRKDRFFKKFFGSQCVIYGTSPIFKKFFSLVTQKVTLFVKPFDRISKTSGNECK